MYYTPVSRAVPSSQATLLFGRLSQVREQESSRAEDSRTRKTTCPRAEISEGAGAVPGIPRPQREACKRARAGTPSLRGAFSECRCLHHATHLLFPKGMCRFSPHTLHYLRQCQRCLPLASRLFSQAAGQLMGQTALAPACLSQILEILS